MSWIAEQRVVFVTSDGTRRAGHIAIGAPVERDQDFACTISLEPVDVPRTLYGVSSLQALLLALHIAEVQLRVFIRDGGRVLFPPDEHDQDGDVDVSVDDYFVRRPPT